MPKEEKAWLDEIRAEAASSSSKRIRAEQFEAAPAAPAPATPLAGEEKAAEEEDSVAVVPAPPPQEEETAPPQKEDAHDADKLARLLATVRQLQALSGVSGPPLPEQGFGTSRTCCWRTGHWAVWRWPG